MHRFLAEPGKLVLHSGVRKSGLMGFCDVAPGEMKHLRVAYLATGRPHVATLTDLQVGSCHIVASTGTFSCSKKESNFLSAW